MDPPSYAATAATNRSIQDLRAQIIANGTLMKPYWEPDVGTADHIEVIVAKTPAFASPQQAYKSTNFNEKQTMRPDGTYNFQPAGRARLQASSSSSTSAAAVPGGKHYAVLVRRRGSNQSKIKIILKGEAKDTVEEALEWMLEKTEMIMHDMVVTKGRQDDEADCVIM